LIENFNILKVTEGKTYTEFPDKGLNKLLRKLRHYYDGEKRQRTTLIHAVIAYR